MIKHDSAGNILTYNLDYPMYEGTLPELSQQLGVTSTSLLRHLAVFDYIATHAQGDEDDPMLKDGDEEHAQIAGLMNSCIINIVSMADQLGIDLMDDLNRYLYLVENRYDI